MVNTISSSKTNFWIYANEHYAFTLPASNSIDLDDGPHGMHNVNDPEWTRGHAPFYRSNAAACQACQGRTLDGGYLSRAAVARRITLPSGRVVNYTQGQQVGCDDCHARP